MNIGILQENKVICRFNLRGMCRFGTRCRNIHESAEKLIEKREAENKAASTSTESTTIYALGAYALSPSKFRDTPTVSESGSNRETLFGPSTSSAEEAIALVKKVESGEKSCGICFDIILQKTERSEQTFGILPNCNHCYCFTCIRKWRQSKEFDLEVAKACPECRVASDFVYPSKFWVDNKEKDDWIGGQKQRMKKMDCKYFREGKRQVSFGNTCLYLHALPNGKTLDVGPPKPRRHRPTSVESELVQQILFLINDDMDEDQDDSDEALSDFDLDLDDPCIAMQYYDHDDIRRYIAMDRLMNGYDTDEDSDCDFLVV
ncbi:hypothetical protein NQ317_002739 [Molorchus minor]|uniref:RING-type E3 ubiquitin transferase n=1 Tax=Molorchus minor TaxID=1323400 RepID=A0ABQ9K416_9CUCU|nr:hypothetical protein NQ317_002739 [Molorchus minor]